ncbi:ROK family protein [Actinoallomurus rhizosphaericola]|uniref:ROK family protein n=1 Tax=Actinoallomurus rhizosphaericola TaxID=2952536 RepID=UPI00209088D5|nr:ROK family protein [Actinoallomurus rhizosphaericola]MCO5994455.1 ROK family protein [Actinoallomurus rhizosphaericola]
MPTRAEAPLPDTAKAVLAKVVDRGQVTRPQLTADVGLSHPTVGTALAELERREFVARVGTTQGALGRAATVYGPGPGLGWVLGVDLGNTHVDVLARSLAGDDLKRERHAVRQGRAQDVAAHAGDIVRAITEGLAAHGPLRAVAVAVGRIIPPGLDLSPADRTARPIERLARDLVTAMRLPDGVPVIFENNVNCAALAESHQGAARGTGDFAYLQIGVRIGLGIVMGGRLLRGATGAGGEVSFLPFPWAPGVHPEREALERHLGSDALLDRARRAGVVPPPETAQQLFEAAAAGDAAAQAQVADHAGEVGRLVAAVAAILDPGLVVLGGGVGKNPQLLPGVGAALRDLGQEIAVTVTELGDDATLEGAALLTGDYALGSILDGYHSPLVERPSVVTA